MIEMFFHKSILVDECLMSCPFHQISDSEVEPKTGDQGVASDYRGASVGIGEYPPFLDHFETAKETRSKMLQDPRTLFL